MAAILLEILFLLLLLFFVLFFVAQFYNLIFRGFAPFISTKKSVIDRIISELTLPDNAVVYELGCGQAGFLRALRKKYPLAKLVGVELSLIPYLIAGVQSSLINSKLTLVRKNIFMADISEADLIYCYLNPEMMAKLEGKFKEEAKKEAQIISYQFFLPTLKPEKVIEAGKHDKIYFYRA